MTTRSRRSGGQAKAAADAQPKDEKPTAEQAEQPKDEAPATEQAAAEETKVSEHGVNAAGPGPSIATQAATASPLVLSGEPQPDTVDRGLVNDETGLSPEVPEPITATAATGDNERNGAPTAIGTDRTGELRKTEQVVTAAHGGESRNGTPDRMLAGQVSHEFGGNDDPHAKLINGGVRAEVGTGTGTPAPAVTQVQYPSTTLTRSTSSAAPMEPADVRRATEPRLGDVATSTDPVMAASTMPSMVGDQTLALVNRAGDEVNPSDFFEVPEGAEGRAFRRVKFRVSRVYTVRNSRSPSQMLMFTEGQLVPVAEAEALISLRG